MSIFYSTIHLKNRCRCIFCEQHKEKWNNVVCVVSVGVHCYSFNYYYYYAYASASLRNIISTEERWKQSNSLTEKQNVGMRMHCIDSSYVVIVMCEKYK